jgi:hypothetical protein
MKMKESIQRLDTYAEGFLHAPHFRARVHLAEHLYDVLDEIYEEIERIVVKGEAMPEGESEEIDPTSIIPREELPLNHRDEPRIAKPLRFRRTTIAQGARTLLQTHGQLHGKDIEKLLKEGGYKSNAEHFQSSLAVALGRDGGFENIGGNTWKLTTKTSVQGSVVPIHVPLLTNGAHSE